MRRSSSLVLTWLTLAFWCTVRLSAAPETVPSGTGTTASAATGATAQAAASEPAKPTEPFANLSARSVGPSIGGRVARVTGVPGDPLTFYAATAAGGVWKSVRRRHRLEADLRRSADVLSIGSIAVAPSDPQRSSTSARARRTSAATSRRATASTSRATPARPGAHVWKQEGQIGTHGGAPAEPGHRLRGGPRPRLRPQPRARRLSHHRRRQDLEPGAGQGRRHRRLRRRPSIPRTRASSSPVSGRRDAGRGT